MARKPFSGISTVEDLRLRCHVDDFTECWHWRGATSVDDRGVRMQRLWVFDAARGAFRVMSGPTAVLEVSGKRRPGMTMGWRTCLCDDCMNPAHVQGGTKADWGVWLTQSGHRRNNAAHTAANRRSGRAKSRLDWDIVRSIRASDARNCEVAAEHSITESHVWSIRAHRTWKESVIPGASVFTLGAR